VGTVNQDSSGVSTATPTQLETQCEDAVAAASTPTTCDTNDPDPPAYQLTQTQYGPVGVGKVRNSHRGRHLYGHLKGLGTATQTGNNGDAYTISQVSIQDDDQGTGSTQLNFGQADCSTPGNCDVSQTTTVNGTTTQDTQSGQNVNSTVNCTGSDCTATPPGSPNVLIAGTGDNGSTEPNDNLTQALTSAGYTVTESPTLPADLSGFGQVWWVDTNPPTVEEQNQLVAFEQSGRGVFLTGEWSNGDGGFAPLDAADESMVNSIVTTGEVTLGGEGCCDGTPIAYAVNPGVVGNLATQPNTVTSWTPTFPGLISGMPDSSVFASYQPDESTTQVAAAAWDRPDTVGNGRLVVFMDINWAEAFWRAPNWSDVAVNVAFFLSSPASPPIIEAPIRGLSRLGRTQALTTPMASTSTASAKTTGTK